MSGGIEGCCRALGGGRHTGWVPWHGPAIAQRQRHRGSPLGCIIHTRTSARHDGALTYRPLPGTGAARAHAAPRGGTRELVAACICAETVWWGGKNVLAGVWVTDAHAKLDLDLGTVRGHGVRHPTILIEDGGTYFGAPLTRCLWQRHRAWSQAMARSAARALALCLATAALLPGRTTGEGR
jgi:hypothetical protein